MKSFQIIVYKGKGCVTKGMDRNGVTKMNRIGYISIDILNICELAVRTFYFNIYVVIDNLFKGVRV